MKGKMVKIKSVDLSELMNDSMLERYMKLTRDVIQSIAKKKDRTVEYLLIYHCDFPLDTEEIKKRLYCLTGSGFEEYILDYGSPAVITVCSFQTLPDPIKDPLAKPSFALQFTTPFQVNNQHLIQYIKEDNCVCPEPVQDRIYANSYCKKCNRELI